MSDRDEIELLSRPIIGVWRVEGTDEEVPGVLSLEGGDLILTLLVINKPPRGSRAKPHPMIEAVEPPRLPNLIGATKQGTITLLRCARNSLRQSIGPNSRGEIEIRLTPHEAFLGNAIVNPDDAFGSLSFRVRGLHNILSTETARTYFLRDLGGEELKRGVDNDEAGDVDPLFDTLRAATDAQRVVLIHKERSPEVEILVGAQTFKIVFYSGHISSVSLTEGDSYATSNSIQIASKDATLSELRHVAMEVRNFLGVFCMCHVAVDRTTLHREEGHLMAHSFWRLGHPVGGTGEERTPFEVWCVLGKRPDILERALAIWFEGGDQRRLARWLLYDGLSDEPLTTSRFLAAAQVWEILGRELHVQPGKLIFRDAVRNCLDHIPGPLLRQLVADADVFAAQVVDVRNALTHMRSGKGMTLDEASKLKGDLTLKLLAGACIIEAWSLRVPLDRSDLVMRKNKLAMMAAWDVSE